MSAANASVRLKDSHELNPPVDLNTNGRGGCGCCWVGRSSCRNTRPLSCKRVNAAGKSAGS
jgi:hypothetical protein